MKQQDVFFIVSSIFLAQAVSNVASYVIGLLYGVCMMYYIWRDE